MLNRHEKSVSYRIFPRLSTNSPKSAWFRMSTGPKEDIMIASTQKNYSQIIQGNTVVINSTSCVLHLVSTVTFVF